ncbi:MAG TPA: hypothetical protein VFW60_04895 [Rhodanobacteraceae bacterium]|nr:hypothetical protein [Rhodanobacteraceae bacterium]
MRRSPITVVWMAGVVLFGASMAAMAATPPAHHRATHAASLRAKLNSVDAKIKTARAHQADLQSQATHLEQQNAAQQKQLQQRDAEIAALQQKLHAAGVPASGTSAGR